MSDTVEQAAEKVIRALIGHNDIEMKIRCVSTTASGPDAWTWPSVSLLVLLIGPEIVSAITSATAGLQKENTRLVGIARAQSALVSYYENEMDRFNYDDEHLPDELLELEEGLREAEAGDKATDPEAMESPDD